MKVLVVGNGGREHALAWKLTLSANVHFVYVAPGNGGTSESPKMENVNIAADDIGGLIEFAKASDVALAVIGPEAPLVAGIVDQFQAAGIRCFGPNQAAAQLEGSKAFTKDFLARHEIPTADYRTFSDLDEALAFIHREGAPLVVKANGLAAGKGVVIAHTVEEANDAARAMLSEGAFGTAGSQIVVERFLVGEEASFIALVDGKNILPLATSQDHKARDDGDRGPNTGGMGAYSPAPVVDGRMHRTIMERIIEPTVAGLAADGIDYQGFLYAGVMIDADGNPYVLEYNCRLGDPETQPILMRLQSDLLELLDATIDRRLNEILAQWDPRTAMSVVMASGGYPGDYENGHVVQGLDDQPLASDVRVFHAGTISGPDGIRTNGGRVLSVCALGDTVTKARSLVYERISSISWQGAFYRRDIGHRAIARDQQAASPDAAMKTIVITGAAGDVGGRLRNELYGHYRLRLSDLNAVENLRAGEEFVRADVTSLEEMEALFAGADGVIALGGESREHEWERILDCNIRGMYHHYEAARRQGVKRVVFASSNHAVGFYRRDETIPVDVTPRPDSRYGVSKAFGESMGALYADKYGLGILCIRIGNVADQPVDKRRLAIWVSPRDLAQLVRIGLDHPDLSFEIVYGMSDNERGWWDNSNAKRLGYAPLDRSEPFASDLLEIEPVSDPDGAPETYQGGDFTQAEIGGGRPASDDA
jgi:phosphoribosylamine---glycine ligase